MPKRKSIKKEIAKETKPKPSFELKRITPLTPNQEKTFQAYRDGANLVLHGYAGTGKAQPLDCNIKIPGGWKRIGDIKIGDEIMCPDGSIVNVIGVYPQGIKDVYELEFYDGRKTECCDEHLWKITSKTARKLKNKTTNEAYNTSEIVSLNYIRNINYKTRRIGIPLVSPEIKDDVKLPIDPYVLGILIGDGSLTCSISFSSNDNEIVQNVIDKGYECTKTKQKYSYSIHGIKDTIKNLDLNVKSEFKHIPKIYLENTSYNQKLDLICGLIDTDGYVSKNGSLSFTTSSEKLKDDFVYLIRSIGGTAKAKLKINTSYKDKNGNKRQGLPSWTIHIRHFDKHKFTKLSRKKERILNSKQQYCNGNLKLKNIKFVGQKECVCISIDHPDKLYITDDFIVTHNTYISTYLALDEVLYGKSTYESVLFIRSVVPSRDIGFLPGSIEEKIKVYEEPFIEIVNDLFQKNNAYSGMKGQGTIDFTTTSFLRGKTFNNTIVIVDEIQNLSLQELDTVMTRMGENSKIIFCGDFRQTDLTHERDKQGLHKFLNILKHMNWFDYIEFEKEDIVRSGIVREYIIKKTELA